MNQDRNMVEEREQRWERYQQIQTYEHHFNRLEAGLRTIASAWLLAALGAIAYLIRDGIELNAPMLITIISLLGNLGLFTLWILDHMVYHRLLNSVFLLGLYWEWKDRTIPPIRTMMMEFSQRCGMARFLRLYYLIPMFGLGGIALGATIWYGLSVGVAGDSLSQLGLMGLFALGALSLPILSVWKATHLEPLHDIAGGLGVPEFVDYLQKKEFHIVLDRKQVEL